MTPKDHHFTITIRKEEIEAAKRDWKERHERQESEAGSEVDQGESRRPQQKGSEVEGSKA